MPRPLFTFNGRHARSGHLFQDRFRSEPASDDAQPMVAVRHIHANPAEDGLTETETVLGIFGGIEAFERFHAGDRSGDRCPDARPSTTRAKLTEEQAPRKAKDAAGSGEIFQLKSPAKEERDAALRRLKEEASRRGRS